MSSADAIGNRDEGGLCLRVVPLGGSPLSRALQRGEDHGWMPPRPRSIAGWRDRALAVREAFDGAAWLSALEPAFGASGAALDRLREAAARGVVVTTGQQPGLFGGPLYTLNKAIGAIAFADALQQALGMPVVPVFWAATDDADWREAAVTRFATASGLRELSLSGPATDGVAMADVPLGDLRASWAALDAASGSGADIRVRRMLESAYHPDASIGGAYVALLRGLLEPFGMPVLDAAHPAVRTAADPLLRTALHRASSIERALVERSRAIEAAGYTPQVEHISHLSLVFQTRQDPAGAGVRSRVPIPEVNLVADHAPSGTLGPNVLLRPIVERTLLPTISYLAGPGEFAYFAQVTAVAEALGVAPPVAAPRFACELIEARHLTRLADLGLSQQDLELPDRAEEQVARAHVSEQASDALERLRGALDAQVRSVGEAVAGEAIVATEVIAGLERDLGHRIDRFERRLLAGIKRREEQGMREVAILRGAIRPLGQSPERMNNPMPLLVRHGLSVLDRLRVCAAPYAEALLQDPSVDS